MSRMKRPFPSGLTTLTVPDGYRCRFPEHVWREVVMQPLEFECEFHMMSEKDKAVEYAMITSGFQRSAFPPPSDKFKERFNVWVDWTDQPNNDNTRTLAVQVWLMPGKYSVSQTAAFAGNFSSTGLYLLREQMWQQVNLRILWMLLEEK